MRIWIIPQFAGFKSSVRADNRDSRVTEKNNFVLWCLNDGCFKKKIVPTCPQVLGYLCQRFRMIWTMINISYKVFVDCLLVCFNWILLIEQGLKFNVHKYCSRPTWLVTSLWKLRDEDDCVQLPGSQSMARNLVLDVLLYPCINTVETYTGKLFGKLKWEEFFLAGLVL